MMFGLFWKKASKLNEIHSDDLQNLDEMNVWYKGEVISGDYNPENPADYPFHNLFPHGHRHLVYKRNGQVIENIRVIFTRANIMCKEYSSMILVKRSKVSFLKIGT